MKHHVEIYDSGHFNFEMIANRIEKFQRDNSSIQTANRSVMLKAFQHLEVISDIFFTFLLKNINC